MELRLERVHGTASTPQPIPVDVVGARNDSARDAEMFTEADDFLLLHEVFKRKPFNCAAGDVVKAWGNAAAALRDNPNFSLSNLSRESAEVHFVKVLAGNQTLQNRSAR
jgi:hypothetical protein